jgi:hypothetical protein
MGADDGDADRSDTSRVLQVLQCRSDLLGAEVLHDLDRATARHVACEQVSTASGCIRSRTYLVHAAFDFPATI